MQNVTCECQPEYSGDRCQNQKNPCIPNPCQEGGGQCFQQGDTFRYSFKNRFVQKKLWQNI